MVNTMNKSNSQAQALLSLIQDNDFKVASLAMEQFLKLEGPVCAKLLAENQEASDPRLRHRIHQMGSIFLRRRNQKEFIQAVKSQDMELWEGLTWINRTYDPQCDYPFIESETEKIAAELKQQGNHTLPQIAAAMREKRFAVPEEEVIDTDLYLVESVLESRFGSAVVCCSLIHHLASRFGCTGTVVLHEGHFCFLDNQNLLLDPASGWQLSKLKTQEAIHPCTSRDIWTTVLAQLLLVSLVDGQLPDIHHFGQLLAALNGTGIEVFPEPLGPAVGGNPVAG